MDKNELRKFYKAARRAVSDREVKERAIADRLLAIAGVAKSVFIYESIGGEVSTVDIIARLKSRADIFVPEVCGRNMLLKKLGTAGYADRPCELTVVPLIAFDDTLNRIGFGGGYYDRYLADNKTFAVGIAFDEQQCARFVKEETDMPLAMIITPTRTLQRS